MKKILFVLAALGWAAGHAWADVPKTINYQGRLTSPAGDPKEGTYSITLSLYADPDGNTLAWRDVFSAPAKNGYFNVVLGAGSQALNIDFSIPYYVGIRVDTDPEMTPRQPLSSVPYALQSNIATMLASSYGLASVQKLTASSGTYTTPAGVRAILVECQGAGGGGGGAETLPGMCGTGQGGRAGGYCAKLIASPATSYNYSVGNRGTGGSAGNNPGTSGGNTSWGSPPIMVAEGGFDGIGGPAFTPPVVFSAGPSTGTGTIGGDINVQQNHAEVSFLLSVTSGVGGYGGGSRFGVGGRPGMNGTAGEAGVGYGAGGGGACAVPAYGNTAGGNGTPGIIYVWEYK